MTNSQRFTLAHKIARETVSIVGDYRIAFSIALKGTHMETKKTMEQKLIEAGCKVWEDYGKKRIYVNAEQMEVVFGLRLNFYGTGSISSAWLNGESISNSKAYKLTENKSYYDCLTGEMHSKMEVVL